jgi:SAM-dependent methyltransferase
VNRIAQEGFVRPDIYEQGRAGYPTGVVDAIGVTPHTRIADIGCGTGKFTRLITHANVIGIEPLEGMRTTFHELLPEVPIVAGLAEALPLADASLDVAAFASAFHWLDHARALPELHRVLHPGGKLAIVWNRRDELSGWARDFWQITEAHRGDTPGYRTGAWRVALEASPHFGPIAERWFEHTQTVDIDGAVARVASISFIETHPDKQRVLDEARRFLEARGEGSFELPYKTVVYLCENLGDA